MTMTDKDAEDFWKQISKLEKESNEIKIPMSHADAWALNNKVEAFIGSENASQSIVDIIPDSVLVELKEFCKSYLNLPDQLPTHECFWFREGLVHHQKLIQDFSKQYVEPLLSEREVLIGDTAFCINYPPHDVHIDNRDFRADLDKQGSIGTRSVVVPIEIDTVDYPKLYTANQYFYGPSTRMRNGCESIDNGDKEIERQKSCGVYFCYDYEKNGVKYLEANNTISEQWWTEHVDEPSIPYSTSNRLSIEAEHDWKPGNLIVFDSSRIHWAENLTKKNATYKIGISLNDGVKFKELD